MIKKIFTTAAILLTLFSPITFAADNNAAPATSGNKIINVEPDKYLDYTSPSYKYTIKCPTKPVATDMKFETPALKGETLFFLNAQNEPLFYYRIEFDAFDGKVVPDFNTADQKTMDAYIEKLKEANLFEVATAASITKDTKGVFAITAKELERKNENGEVELVTANQQAAVTYFRTKSGKCMSIMIVAENLTEELLDAYRYSVTTFQEK